MIIAIDPKYNELKMQLENLGYKTVDYKYRGKKIDALLYHSGEGGGFTNIKSLPELNNSSNGVLLIDIKNKDAKIIHEILQRRLYTPLF